MSKSDFYFVTVVCVISLTCVSCDYIEDKTELNELEKERTELSIKLLKRQLNEA